MRSWCLRNMLKCVGNERHDNILEVILVLSGDIYIIFNLDMYPMISHNEVMASVEHAQVCWEQKS
jgi:hypothetical protein